MKRKYRRRKLVIPLLGLLGLTAAVLIATTLDWHSTLIGSRFFHTPPSSVHPATNGIAPDLNDPGLQQLLAHETGFTKFWFNSSVPAQHDGLTVFWTAPDRSLVFDPATTSVVLSTRTHDRKWIQRRQPLDLGTSFWHFIAAQWTPHEAMLIVDGAGWWSTNTLDEAIPVRLNAPQR